MIFATNCANYETIAKLQAFIKELLSCDPNELYLQQVETNAETQSETSGLGLLTMINDYSAKIGWRFETIPDSLDTILVTTVAQIIV